MENKKLYMIIEEYYYTEPYYEKDTLTHMITHDYNKALEEYNKLVAEEKEYFKEQSKTHAIEINEEKDNIMFIYKNTQDYKQIILEVYVLEDNQYKMRSV